MEDILGDLPGCRVITDDILVWGIGDEHDIRLKMVLDRAEEHGLHFTAPKIVLDKPEVKYVGHIFSGEGVKPNPE